MSKKVEIRVSLEEEFIEKIERLKSYYGIKNNTELIKDKLKLFKDLKDSRILTEKEYKEKCKTLIKKL